jgi:DNA-binding NtrC family response regulator
MIVARAYDLVLFDIDMEGCCATELLLQVTNVARHPPVIIVSRVYSLAFFKFVVKAGACGYFSLSRDTSILIDRIERYVSALSGNNGCFSGVDTKDELSSCLLGKSSRMVALRQSILALRDRRENVMIYGETGSGKDLVARMVHENSPVASGPCVVQNVSCITASLAESILFGTVRGSYTGAEDRKGLFEEANRGTLFLDEIGELDLSLQPKFLRVLEDRRVSPLGSSCPRSVDFRLVCATNRSLVDAVDAGLFRADLFQRIDVLRLEVPPLRDHPEDIPALAASRLSGYRKILSNASLDKLCAYHWPGNIRQLFNCLSRAACCSPGDVIYPDQILF